MLKVAVAGLSWVLGSKGVSPFPGRGTSGCPYSARSPVATWLHIELFTSPKPAATFFLLKGFDDKNLGVLDDNNSLETFRTVCCTYVNVVVVLHSFLPLPSSHLNPQARVILTQRSPLGRRSPNPLLMFPTVIGSWLLSASTLNLKFVSSVARKILTW